MLTAAGDGALLTAAPKKAGTDRFAYDPANPVIAHGGQIDGMGADQEDGAFDQRAIEKRPDVLVYTTPPLTADTPVFGYVTAQLYVASDAPDTDFTVKLVDVAPDGTASFAGWAPHLDLAPLAGYPVRLSIAAEGGDEARLAVASPALRHRGAAVRAHPLRHRVRHGRPAGAGRWRRERCCDAIC